MRELTIKIKHIFDMKYLLSAKMHFAFFVLKKRRRVSICDRIWHRPQTNCPGKCHRAKQWADRNDGYMSLGEKCGVLPGFGPCRRLTCRNVMRDTSAARFDNWLIAVWAVCLSHRVYVRDYVAQVRMYYIHLIFSAFLIFCQCAKGFGYRQRSSQHLFKREFRSSFSLAKPCTSVSQTFLVYTKKYLSHIQ